MRNLLQKIIKTSGAKIYSVLLGIITLSITARWLGPEGRGIFATVHTWVYIFIEISALSLGPVLIFKATHNRDDGWFASVMGALFRHTIYVSLIGWAIVLVIYLGGEFWNWPNVFGDIPALALFIGFIALPFGLWDLYTNSLLNIQDRFSIYNKFQIIGSTTNTIAVVVLVVFSGLGVLGVIISKVLWQFTVAFGGIKSLLDNTSSNVKYNADVYKDLLKSGLKMHIGTIGAIMTLNIDIVMVNAYLGNERTGIYELAVQMSQLMLIVSYAATTVLEGELTRKGVHGIWPYQKKILGLTLIFIVCASLIMGSTAKWWLIWLAGIEFKDSIIIFQLLLITIVVNTITAVMSVQWVGRGLFLLNSIITLIKGTMNIGLNALLIPKYGILGAVYATIAVISLSLFINIAMIIYCELDNRKYKKQLKQSN
ncbi:MAG: O-antigen/teichoic acid export membrane protein [Cocleimonas sp.]|jgi:O-antigen/teichoic acid export membrane protein